MRRVVAVLALALAACSSTPDAPSTEEAPPFPEQVVLRTGKLAFNSFFSFALDERGRIWAKPVRACPETAGMAPRWQLFLGTGLPRNAAKKDFVDPERIVAIDADADELMAISEKLRHYSLRWQPNPVFAGTPRQWTDIEGWPVEGPHVWDERVKDNRGWGIGRRNQLCEWFEDVAGKSHWGGGGLTTYYFLSRDGTEVYFSDSGLPPDFSHTLAGPRRSTFVACGFAVSASTMFVIDRYGEMFTRLADFDASGSDVMFFEYTYDRTNTRKNVIAIPSEDWLGHAKIPLTGKARITSQLTVVQLGPHNRARELRVGGTDAEGRAGYYAKAIFKQEAGSPVREPVNAWEFHPVADLALDPARFLDPADCARTEPGPGAPSRDVAMKGKLEADKKLEPVAVELLDWNLECSPATLRVSSAGASVDVVLHTVEEWYHLKRKDPGRDGTPKKLLGTLEVPHAAVGALDGQGPLGRVVGRDLAPYNLKDFAFWVEATEDYVVLESKPRRGAPALTLSFTRDGRSFRTLEAVRRESLERNGFAVAACAEALTVPGDLHAFGDAQALKQKLLLNESVRKDLKAAFEENQALDAQTPFYVTGPGIQVVRALGTLLGGASLWAPYVKNLLGELPSLIVKNEELKRTILFSSREDYEEGVSILDARIAAYGRRLAELETQIATRWDYAEPATGPWKPFALGVRAARAHGTLDRGVPGECRITVDDSELAEPLGHRTRALVVEAECASLDGGAPGHVRLRVVPRALAKRIFETSQKATVAAHGNPLVLDAKVTLDYLDAIPVARSLLRSVIPDATEREVTEATKGQLTVEDGHYALSIAGFVIDWEK